MRGIGRLFAAALALGLLAGCGGGSAADDAPAPPPDSPAPLVAPGTWVVVGSSTAAGAGATSGAAWAQRLGVAVAASGVEITNLARHGLRSGQALPVTASAPAPARSQRPPPDPAVNIDRALAMSPRLLLLSFPSNDAVDRYSAQETVYNLRVMRQAASAAGTATLVLGSQPRVGLDASQQDIQAEVDRQLTAEAGPCFVPLYHALADGTGLIAARYRFGDGIHLNDAGHELIFRQILATLGSGRCVRLSPR